MTGVIAWFARNHVAANLLMVLLVVGGLLTAFTLRQEMLPDIDLDVVTIAIAYPGASPEEVEQAVSIRVEEELQGLSGVKRIRSTSSEGSALVTVELLSGENVDRRLADVRARVAAIDTLPDQTERPVVRQAEFGRQVLAIAVSGQVDEWTLKHLGERVRDELAALPEITEVSLSSVRPYEVSIEISEAALRRHGLRFDDVVQAVRNSSLDLPGGSIKATSGEILLRAKGQAYDREAFERIPLVVRADGTRLEVGAVARVIDGFAETDQVSRFDGEPAVLVQVFRVGEQKMLEVAEAAESYVARTRQTLPDGVSLTVWQNGANYLSDRLGSMFRNARGGFVLVLLVLALFLRLRLALWVSLGIPVAFLGAVAILPFLDISVNWISLMGFIVVLGIVVDDAIVVGENTYTEQRRAQGKLVGAIRGAQGLAVPVVFGVATTIAAFAPMLFIPGAMGRLVRALPVVVIACLVFSLIEAMLVLPAHLGHGRPLDQPPRGRLSVRWRRVQDRVEAGLERMIRRRYRPALRWALEWRYLTLAIGLSLLIFTGGLLGAGWLRFTFQEPVEGDTIVADLTMAPGSSAETTAVAVGALERAALQVQAETDAARDTTRGSIFSHILASVGEQPWVRHQSQMPGGRGGHAGGPHLGEVQVEMIHSRDRDVGTDEMQRRWRERVGQIPGAVELSFKNSMVQVGAPIELELSGGQLAELRAAAVWLKERLAGYPGVFDVADSFRGGKQELQFQILPSAQALGLTLADVARQVRQGFYGDEAQRIQRGRDDVKVVVRYPAAQRRSLGDIEQMRIRTSEGSEVPFRSVATLTVAEGFSTIRRVSRRRVVTVTADVDTALANANEIVAELERTTLPELRLAFPGISASFEGEQAEQAEFLAAMVRGQIVALLVIYALLAIPLRSYLQPLVIMSAIPFGLVGAAWGHVLLGYDFSMYSVVGLVALSGVVVNASLVLVDAVNTLRAQGRRTREAVVEAAEARLRAILLTSLTTFVGLLPMMLETNMAARFMIPTAISLAFGVLFASLITLFLVPCGTLLIEDLAALLGAAPRGAEVPVRVPVETSPTQRPLRSPAR